MDLVDRELVVFRSAQEGDYRHRVALHAGDRIALDAWPDVVIDVGELLPPDDPS